MPTRLDTNFGRLSQDNEFESLLADLCALEWNDPHTEKNGRSGQAQKGVDIYGRPPGCQNYRAAQCKLRKKNDRLTKKEIEHEVAEAKTFEHALDLLILATDADRDTHTQRLVDDINNRERQAGGFTVIIWFWDTITKRLAAHPNLIVKYYRAYFENLTTFPIVDKLVDTPLQVIAGRFGDSSDGELIEDCLCFRGIRLVKAPTFKGRPDKHWQNSSSPDGVLLQYCALESPLSQEELVKVAHNTVEWCSIADHASPKYLLLPPSLTSPVLEQIRMLGEEPNNLTLVSRDQDPCAVADTIFKSTFAFGYSRRGRLPTIDATIRSIITPPTSALLDLDWQKRLSTSKFPTPDEWHHYFTSALRVVANTILAHGDRLTVQITSQLPLPAAIATGFLFSIREARVSVWTRTKGASDFKEQLWHSDARSSSKFKFGTEIIDHSGGAASQAVVELCLGPSIHLAVEQFVAKSNIMPRTWAQISRLRSVQTIEESLAVSYAEYVGRTLRGLTAKGVTDIHLFARMPSALAVLIGQRLHACGRIHLYWFANPDYRFAFTLE